MFEFSNMGTPYRIVREPALSKDGKLEVVEVGKEDMRAYINSFADSCDVETIVSRAMNGEPELLEMRKGAFGDFTQFPKTYAEALQRVIDAKNIFDGLSADVRSRFDNDVFKFVSEMDNEDWLEKAGFKSFEEDVEDKEVKE